MGLLVQQDQARDGIVADPDDGVLIELLTDQAGIFQIQSDHKKTFFDGPFPKQILMQACCNGIIPIA